VLAEARSVEGARNPGAVLTKRLAAVAGVELCKPSGVRLDPKTKATIDAAQAELLRKREQHSRTIGAFH
jgi:hypothetical protein